MAELREFNEIEISMRASLEALSNKEPLLSTPQQSKSQLIDDVSAAVERQLTREAKGFTIRASNIGRPLCQLQMEKSGVVPERMEYNHILRMLIGDITEAVVSFILRSTDINVTSTKERVSFNIDGYIIEGETDLKIDGKVWDIKSASPYSFANKWNSGWEGLYANDTFGYVEQLFVYAEGDPSKMGGWIVVDKSSGEVQIVPAKPSPAQIEAIRERISTAIKALTTNTPFKRVFADEAETYYNKPTGNRVVPKVCLFCPFLTQCWTDAVLRPKTQSRAEKPPLVWYTFIKDETENDKAS